VGLSYRQLAEKETVGNGKWQTSGLRE